MIASVLAVLLTACGGQESSPTTSPEATTVGTADPGATTAGPATVTPEATRIAPAAMPVLPTASFSVDVASGSAPVTVKFISSSQGRVTSVEWDFGDDSTSVDQAPTHRYTVAGTYDVELTVTGPWGTDTSVMSGLITVEPGPPVTLKISPETVTIAVREGVSFIAVARDEFGNVVHSAFKWSTDKAAGRSGHRPHSKNA